MGIDGSCVVLFDRYSSGTHRYLLGIFSRFFFLFFLDGDLEEERSFNGARRCVVCLSRCRCDVNGRVRITRLFVDVEQQSERTFRKLQIDWLRLSLSFFSFFLSFQL